MSFLPKTHGYHGNQAIEKIWNIHFLFKWILNFFKMYSFATLQKIPANVKLWT